MWSTSAAAAAVSAAAARAIGGARGDGRRGGQERRDRQSGSSRRAAGRRRRRASPGGSKPTGRIAQRESTWATISVLTASSVSSAATLVAISARLRISAVAPNAPTRGSLRISRRRCAVDVRADGVGDVREAVLVQGARDRGWRRRSRAGSPGAAGGAGRRRRGWRPRRRRRAGRRAGRPARRGSGPGSGGVRDRQPREEGERGPHRAAISRSASSRTATRMCSASSPRSSVGRTAMPCVRSRSTVPAGTLTRRKFAAPG